MKKTLVYSVRTAARRQSVILSMSAGSVHDRQHKMFTALNLSVNDQESTMNVDSGIISKFSK